MDYREITPQELKESACQLIGKNWMLVTAGDRVKVNTMTASWGGLGEMWNRAVAFVVIRPQRYTKEFVDAQETMSLSFYPEGYREKLSYLGTASGRDEDKIAKAGLTLQFAGETPYFEEADIVMVAKKLYCDQYKPECFFDPQMNGIWYPGNDHHHLYICEIQKVMVRSQ